MITNLDAPVKRKLDVPSRDEAEIKSELQTMITKMVRHTVSTILNDAWKVYTLYTVVA